MIKNKSLLLVFLLCIFSFLNGNSQEKVTNPKNEFRAVWIATVANIDWPKAGTDSIEKQKADFIAILDAYKKLNYNAVIVQIRSCGDAFYPTQLAPWSRYLTGKEGQAPQPYYDPLAWMIEQAHQRGFEFHAWLNPYRATMDTKKEKLSKEHDFFKHRDWMIKYGETGKEKYYYNPALPEVQSHLTAVVEEVVKNYDIDAIHFDDYFYPYRVTGKVFNDAASFKKYSYKQSLEDWRRDNVNSFVKNIYFSIKRIKPWVQFGISPFGVWRNKSVDPRGSDTQAGQTNYDDLYADPIAWMEGKYIDYMLPQLYWSIDHKTASYAKLIKWWAANTTNSNLYIGNGSYKIKTDSDKKWFIPAEIPNQIDLARTYSNIQGNAYFSAKCFVNCNSDVANLLENNQYKYPAIPFPVPSSVRTGNERPLINTYNKQGNSYQFSFKKTQSEQIRYIVVYSAENNMRIDSNNPRQIVEKVFIDAKNESIKYSITKDKLNNAKKVAFTFIDFYGNESVPEIVNLNTEIKQN
ncbi:family 10 glycosylhydrolase [Flavobacterium sp.]|uniref:glycoside hydrolase family 10 protein n=1 Tax=Flavobacterium sp. TaxID=239 RepID=UPI00286E2165|nr:family 10 glycosylhydrolase [Flavobacterium sp.]